MERGRERKRRIGLFHALAAMLALTLETVSGDPVADKRPSLGVHFNNSAVASGGAEYLCSSWKNIAASPGGIRYFGPYADDAGKGSVTVNWGKPGQSSVYNSQDGQFPGRAPLLRGEAKMHYYGQEWGMTEVPYANYDVYLYGTFGANNRFTIDVACTNGTNQTASGAWVEPGPAGYEEGRNYMAWRGVTNDHFHLAGSECNLSALQIVKVPPPRSGTTLIVR
jgi:hypothetical protein